MIVVVDASVALKWFFDGRNGEEDVDNALALLTGVADGSVSLRQPPHFLAEVAAVLSREKPDGAADDLLDLQLMDWQVVEGTDIYGRAIELSRELRHHLFDTLYHATALAIEGAELITSDRRYYDRAALQGDIRMLADCSFAA